jgi:hypothetical protein
MTKLRADQDSPWKLVLRQYFREAMEFFFPAVAKVVDWTKPIEFLDKEFQKITPDAEVGKRFADQLVKVHQKRGKALILLIHVEIQAVPEKGFAERMFIMQCESLSSSINRRPVWRFCVTRNQTGDPFTMALPPLGAPFSLTLQRRSYWITRRSGHSWSKAGIPLPQW